MTASRILHITIFKALDNKGEKYTVYVYIKVNGVTVISPGKNPSSLSLCISVYTQESIAKARYKIVAADALFISIFNHNLHLQYRCRIYILSIVEFMDTMNHFVRICISLGISFGILLAVGTTSKILKMDSWSVCKKFSILRISNSGRINTTYASPIERCNFGAFRHQSTDSYY